MLAAAVRSLPSREVLIPFDRKEGIGEVPQDLFEAGVDLHALGWPEIGIPAVIGHVPAETYQEIVADHALISFRRENGNVVDAHILDPNAAGNGPVAIQLPANGDARPEPLLYIFVVNAIVEVTARRQTIRLVKKIRLAERGDI